MRCNLYIIIIRVCLIRLIIWIVNFNLNDFLYARSIFFAELAYFCARVCAPLDTTNRHTPNPLVNLTVVLALARDAKSSRTRWKGRCYRGLPHSFVWGKSSLSRLRRLLLRNIARGDLVLHSSRQTHLLWAHRLESLVWTGLLSDGALVVQLDLSSQRRRGAHAFVLLSGTRFLRLGACICVQIIKIWLTRLATC